MRYYKLMLVCLLFTFISCQQRSSKVLKSVIQGIWKMHGYGQIVRINKADIEFYDVTKKSCLPVKTISLKNIKEFGDIVSITADTLLIHSGINFYSFTRLKELPEPCKIHSDLPLKDPTYNFEVFWHTFNENYAFFQKRDVDWDQIYKDYGPKINRKTSDRDLYLLLNEIITKFKDGHITLDAPEDIVKEAALPIQKISDGSSITRIPNVNPLKFREALLNRYLKRPTFSGRDLYGNGLLNWGITKENVGYIQVNWMLFFHDYKIADSVKGDDYVAQYFQKAGNNPRHMSEEVEQVRKIMNRAITDLKDVDGIILDIRFNGGGYDGVALEILSHFINKKTMAFSKRTWLGRTFSDATTTYVSPSGKRFLGPVMLLTSHSTASAAEILAMASMGLKNFNRIGSSTEGIFSDRLEKKLPNGWSFSLSNEVYINSLHENFENSGIPPRIMMAYPLEVNKFRYVILKNMRVGDPAIDTAISLITMDK